MGNPVQARLALCLLSDSKIRVVHFLAFSVSNFAKSLMRPIDLHAIIAIIHTIDYD